MLAQNIADRAELGRLAGIPYHRLNPWWIRATSKPNASDLLAVAKTLNVSENYLLNGGDRRPFDRLEALLKRAENLDEKLQGELESYLEYLEQKSRLEPK